MCLIFASAALFFLQDTAAEDVRARALFEFPPGAIADLLRGCDPSTIPAETPADLGQRTHVPHVQNAVWAGLEGFEIWSALVAAESKAVRPDAERRARLALLADAQERSTDAWRHVAKISDPGWVAAVLPCFLPGVPERTPIGVGGASGKLADGVVLTPSLPPPSASVRSDGRVDRRAMTIRSFDVGAAKVSMRVSVEAEGVQIDVKHVSGESAKLSILIPSTPDYAFADEYVDWYRQDTMRIPHAIEVKPGEAEHTIYGRFEPRQRVERNRVPRALPGAVREGGVWFTIGASDPDRARIEGIAEMLTRNAFGFHVGVRDAYAAHTGFSGVTFALEDPATRAEKLAWLASAIEEFALQDAPR